MSAARLVGAALVFGACLATVHSTSQAPPALELLDRYAAGQFEAVARAIDEITDFDPLLKDLERHAESWLAAGGPGERPRRELAAATFALEAARAAEWREWKWIQRPPPETSPLPTLYWRPAPRLIEWGCTLLRRTASPRPIERFWQLAALAVAQRSEDSQFLIGNIQIVAQSPTPSSRFGPAPVQRGRGRGPEVINSQDEINHLRHARERFPGEMRFLLAEGIARDRIFPDEAVLAYGHVANDPDVAGEAQMRLGALHLRLNRLPNAMAAFDRAERLTRDTYVIHLTRFFRGQALARQKRDTDSIAAFRGALAARPSAQSASVALAELLFKAGRRTEAQDVMAAVLAADRATPDPYLEHVHADDRFWPELIGRLRREITP